MDSSITEGSEAATSANQIARVKNTLTKTLPTERLAIERQFEIIRAFAAVSDGNNGGPVKNEDAATVSKLAAATIAMAHPFFVDVGLLARAESGFSVAPEARAFLNAEHGIAPENAAEKLRPLFDRHWSAALLVPRLRVGPMEYEAARKVIGEACGATPDHLPRLDRMLEFLLAVGIIKRDGTSIKIGNGKATDPNPVTKKDPHENSDPKIETYSLILDANAQRKIQLTAPPQVTESELKRIQQWISFQLIVTKDAAQV